MPDLPADAIRAAAEAIHAAKLRHWDGVIDPDALAHVALEAAAPALRAQGAAAERARIREAIIAEARRMGYVAGEVATAAWPHLADFVADLLDGGGDD